jgi:hypothetical protein
MPSRTGRDVSKYRKEVRGTATCNCSNRRPTVEEENWRFGMEESP